MKRSYLRKFAMVLLVIAILSTITLGIFTVYIGTQCGAIVIDILKDNQASISTLEEFVEPNCTLIPSAT